jgi:CheY-like chemotaxis protein
MVRPILWRAGGDRKGHASPERRGVGHSSELRGAVKVLVADDDRVISELICSVLRRAGHQPLPAYDAMQALMFAMRAPSPGLIVLDINMPGGTGIEALRRLKQSARTWAIPVIVVSGVADLAMPAQVLELGALSVLPKPIDPEALLDSVQRALSQSAA